MEEVTIRVSALICSLSGVWVGWDGRWWVNRTRSSTIRFIASK